MLSPSQKKTSGSAAAIAPEDRLLGVELVARAGAEGEAEGRGGRRRRVRPERRQTIAVGDAVDQQPVVVAASPARRPATAMRTVKSLAAVARTGGAPFRRLERRVGRSTRRPRRTRRSRVPRT